MKVGTVTDFGRQLKKAGGTHGRTTNIKELFFKSLMLSVRRKSHFRLAPLKAPEWDVFNYPC